VSRFLSETQVVAEFFPTLLERDEKARREVVRNLRQAGLPNKRVTSKLITYPAAEVEAWVMGLDSTPTVGSKVRSVSRLPVAVPRRRSAS